MKYISKIPKKSIETYNEIINSGWNALKEPKNLILATIISVPISFISIYISLLFLNNINNYPSQIIENLFHSSKIVINIRLSYIFLIYIYILIHEIIHLIFVPNFVKSKSTFISVKFWGGFVYTEEEMSKYRFLLVTILPFVILSFVSPFILNLLGINPSIILTLVIINSAGSSVDILTFFLVLFQVPRNSTIKNSGIKTFFRGEL